MSRTLDYTKELIRRASVTPEDQGCQAWIIEKLEVLGFKCETLWFEEVRNLWARRGTQGPVFAFAGHTDVVPPGEREQWDSDPFVPTVRDGVLFGRGAADMKSGLAAMTTAVEDALSEAVNFDMAFLITSDEEGPCRDGTRYVAKILQERGIRPDYVIVGEATADEIVGDRFIVGRRGSLGCNLTVHGVQGHVAYPHKADNPVHRMLPALAELCQTQWDQGNEDFPPTSFQISNVHSGQGVTNVIPGEAQVIFNFRYSPASDAEDLKQQVEACLQRHEVKYTADWWHTGTPYYTPADVLSHCADAAILAATGRTATHFTGGGTSDGRFLAPLGAQVIELGPVSASIHKFNEHLRLSDFAELIDIYTQLLRELSEACSGKSQA